LFACQARFWTDSDFAASGVQAPFPKQGGDFYANIPKAPALRRCRYPENAKSLIDQLSNPKWGQRYPNDAGFHRVGDDEILEAFVHNRPGGGCSNAEF